MSNVYKSSLFVVLLAFAIVMRGGETNVTDRLREGLSGVTSVRATFTQEKTLSLFKNKLTITGRMLLDGKGSLLWVTDAPVRSALTIREGTLRQWDGESDRVTSLPVSKIPALPALIGQIQYWLRGDFDALIRDYDIRVEKESPPTLVCAPKQAESAPFESITLVFCEAPYHLSHVSLVEAGGNLTTLLFENVELNAPVRPSDWELPPKQR